MVGKSMLIGIAFCVIQFIVFVLTVIGTPLDIYRPKSNNASRWCHSMWGSRPRCNRGRTVATEYSCNRDKHAIRAARAFSIISIFLTLMALVLGGLVMAKILGLNIIPGIFSALAMVTLLITWTCIAGVFHNRCGLTRIRSAYNLGAGFGLLVTAWCLQFINMFLAFLV